MIISHFMGYFIDQRVHFSHLGKYFNEEKVTHFPQVMQPPVMYRILKQ